MAVVSNKVVEDALALAQSGAVERAFHMLERGIADGNAMAAATLAQWRLSGQIIRRDLGLARQLYGAAADLGIEAAVPVHIALLANGAGGISRHWQEALGRLETLAPRDGLAARQIELLQKADLTEEGEPRRIAHGVTRIEHPSIATFSGFLSPEECAYLVERAASMMQPSVVVHPKTGALVRDPVRTAKSAGFPFVLEDPVIHAINRRIAAATGTGYAQGEPLQVLRYDDGDEYRLHSDALPSGENQRVLTFLVALNDGYHGGATEFPDLSFSWKGKPGDALRFVNVDEKGAADPRCRHAGTPVISGTKYLLSKWIRQNPLDLSGPPGRPF